MTRRLNITLMHLDLGIGGAERLVVDTAIAFKNLGHNVEIITSHHDPNHCFEETLDPALLGGSVTVIGDWLPRHIFGRFTVFCAVLRMLYMALVLVFGFIAWGHNSSSKKKLRQYLVPDLVFVDGVSAPLLLLYLFGIPTMFYCHYPDMLLVTKRGGIFQRLYRNFFDKIEEFTTGHANLILVNSKFTQQRFAECFPSINAYCPATVVYPTLPIDTSAVEGFRSRNNDDEDTDELGNLATKNVGITVKKRLRRVGEGIDHSKVDMEHSPNDWQPNRKNSDGEFPAYKFIPDKFVHAIKPSNPAADTSKILDGFGNWGESENLTCSVKGSDFLAEIPYANADFVFVSLNRFERKKNISLALQAFKIFKEQLKALAERSVPGKREDSQVQIVYLRNNSSKFRQENGESPRNNDGGPISPGEQQQDIDDGANLPNAASSANDSYVPQLKLRKGLHRQSADSYSGESSVSPVRSAPPIAVVDSPKMLHIPANAKTNFVEQAKSSPLIRENQLPVAPVDSPTSNGQEAKRERVSSIDLTTGFVLDPITDNFLANFQGNIANARVKLIVAGGYEKCVPENVEYLEALKREADVLGLSHAGPDTNNLPANVDVVFRTSIPNRERRALLKVAVGLLYTPDMEHFGIVPLEAMKEGTPVIAVNSGGPLETVVHGRTGYLCNQNPQAFAAAMSNLLQPVVIQVLQPQVFENLKKRQTTGYTGDVNSDTGAALRVQVPQPITSTPPEVRHRKMSEGTLITSSTIAQLAQQRVDERLHEAPLGNESPTNAQPVVRERRSSRGGSEGDVRKFARSSGIETTCVMTTSRRFGLHCKKHVVENFSMDTMKSSLMNALIVCLGTTRSLSQLDIFDPSVSITAYKKAINANIKRLDEYSSILFIGFAMICAFGMIAASMAFLALAGNQH